MAGFGRLFNNLTDQVFKDRFQPRIANVWDRTASRTAHLFDNANLDDESHEAVKSQIETKADEATLDVQAVSATAMETTTAEASTEEETAAEETVAVETDDNAEAKISDGSCGGEGGGCACNEFGCGCGCGGGEVSA